MGLLRRGALRSCPPFLLLRGYPSGAKLVLGHPAARLPGSAQQSCPAKVSSPQAALSFSEDPLHQVSGGSAGSTLTTSVRETPCSVCPSDGAAPHWWVLPVSVPAASRPPVPSTATSPARRLLSPSRSSGPPDRNGHRPGGPLPCSFAPCPSPCSGSTRFPWKSRPTSPTGCPPTPSSGSPEARSGKATTGSAPPCGTPDSPSPAGRSPSTLRRPICGRTVPFSTCRSPCRCCPQRASCRERRWPGG